jgi:1,4-alpha-glucan branching enzyme
MVYAFTENFMLPLSHDEVTHGKGSLLSKMPGSDDWQKMANLRLLYGYMYSQPGKKLLFMGAEIGQWHEWEHDGSLDWHLLQYAPHQGIERWLADLNRLYASQPALHAQDCDWHGFSWIDCNDSAASILAFMRHGNPGDRPILVVANFTPVPRTEYRVGVAHKGAWRELLNSDADVYGGSGMGNLGTVEARSEPSHERPHSLVLTLPPLAVVFLVPAE